MPLTRTLIHEMVWPAFKAAKDYVKPKTIEAVRRSAWDRFATILRRPEIGADLLPGLEDLGNPMWNRIRDSIWQFDKEMVSAGQHVAYLKQIKINPTERNLESIGVHELAHHIYTDLFTKGMRKEWGKVASKYGRPTSDLDILKHLKGHPKIAKHSQYGQQMAEYSMTGQQVLGDMPAEQFINDTESLAFTIQDILTPGREITTPTGMLRGIERIFNARGLVERVSHRIPPARNVFIGPLERTGPKRLIRLEEPGVRTGLPESKPHGLYTTPEEFFDPKLRIEDELTGTKTIYERRDKNPLNVTGKWKGDILPFRGGIFEPSAGVKALKALTSEKEFNRLSRLFPREMKEELKKYPGVDWSKYYDDYERLEAMGAIKARKAGYDSIVDMGDSPIPELRGFAEVVILKNKAIRKISEGLAPR